jgi:DNA-binding LacI/PurR family transcriptional regulator
MSHDAKELGIQAATLLFERLAGTTTSGPRSVTLPVEVRRFWQ